VDYLCVMFAADDLDEMLTRLRRHGTQLADEVVQYGNMYRHCYIRGPEGILIGLAEQLGDKSIKNVLENDGERGRNRRNRQ
jgi:predicted enzyme related to lactoylglutathione lyase